MDVSIIIINYNTFDLTCACIGSVIEKTSGVSYEIILVDNASYEKNPEKFKEIFPQIILIRNKDNLGFAKGNNAGIKTAQGKVILLLNSDTELINNAVYEGYKVLNSNEKIGVVSGQLLHKTGEVQAVAGKFPSLSQEVFDLFRLSKFISKERASGMYLGSRADYSKEFECDWVWGSYFMFRKSDLLSFPSQRLHDSYFMYYEDVQWCYFFKKKLGKKIVFSPLPKLYHYIGGSDSNKNLNKKYFEKIFQNEYDWMVNEKGYVYTRLYYLVKGIHLMSSLQPKTRKKGKFYLTQVFLK